MKRNILFVNCDDKFVSEVRDSFSQELCSIYLTKSGEDALEIIGRQKINLLVSNGYIPDMDILIFLKKVKILFPLTIRILCSDNTSDEYLFKIFNNNLCRYMLKKPVSKTLFISTIDGLFNLEEKLNSKELLSIINTLDKIPVLTDTYIQVNQMIEDDEDINSITEIIEKDIAMSVKILQVVNSAFYNIKTGSIKQAITILGLYNIKNILLTTIIFDFFDSHSHKKMILWKHALNTNKILLQIYKKLLNKELSNLFSSAGMLHDFGKIILCKNYTENYMKIFKLVEDNKMTFTDAEREVLNICNGEIGAYLLTWWDIPTPIVESAMYHETPDKASEINRELVSAVHIASYYAWQKMNIITAEKLDENVFDFLGFSKKDCETLVNKIILES